MYEKMLKLTELSHFWADFDPLKNMFLALKSEPLDQIRRNCQFSKHKEFLKSGGKDNSMQHHCG